MEPYNGSIYRKIWYKQDVNGNYKLNRDLKGVTCLVRIVDPQYLENIWCDVETHQTLQTDCFNINLGFLDRMKGIANNVLKRLPFMNVPNDPLINLVPYTTVIPKVLFVQRATSYGKSTSNIETFRMQGKNRGVLFLVNNIDFPDAKIRRHGAEIDKMRLLDLFNQMGFTIFYYENLKKGQFMNLVEQLSTSDHLRSSDCLFFGVLTHGNQ